MAAIASFRDLKVYQRAIAEARKLFLITKDFPREEMYALTDQMRRASRAVGAMLAEAWARRRYQAAFVNKLNEALAEAMETQAWLDHARSCEYITATQHRELDETWQHIGAMLHRMTEQADAFCKTDA